MNVGIALGDATGAAPNVNELADGALEAGAALKTVGDCPGTVPTTGDDCIAGAETGAAPKIGGG